MSTLENKLKNFPYQLILGSASPRRQELLKGLGFLFTIQPTHADENFPEHLIAHEIPLHLAKIKANAFPRELKPDELLITSDTIVWCENKVLNKPGDYNEGKKMLELLSGKMHKVFTAVCIKGKNKESTFYDESNVYFKHLSAQEIDHYLTHFSPYDKAGGYGVQDWIGYVGIEKIEGSFYNVMGLPVKKLYEALMLF